MGKSTINGHVPLLFVGSPEGSHYQAGSLFDWLVSKQPSTSRGKRRATLCGSLATFRSGGSTMRDLTYCPMRWAEGNKDGSCREKHFELLEFLRNRNFCLKMKREGELGDLQDVCLWICRVKLFEPSRPQADHSPKNGFVFWVKIDHQQPLIAGLIYQLSLGLPDSGGEIPMAGPDHVMMLHGFVWN